MVFLGVGFPRLQGFSNASVKEVDESGWSSIWSNSRCAKTSAEEFKRFRLFKSIEAGTSCAIATRPTNKMIVANIISRRMKPSWREREPMDERCIIVSRSYASADSLPRSALRRGPNLRATGRKQNHRAIAELRIVRTAEVKDKNVGGNIFVFYFGGANEPEFGYRAVKIGRAHV